MGHHLWYSPTLNDVRHQITRACVHYNVWRHFRFSSSLNWPDFPTDSDRALRSASWNQSHCNPVQVQLHDVDKRMHLEMAAKVQDRAVELWRLHRDHPEGLAGRRSTDVRAIMLACSSIELVCQERGVNDKLQSYALNNDVRRRCTLPIAARGSDAAASS